MRRLKRLHSRRVQPDGRRSVTDSKIVITAFGDRDTGGGAFVLEGDEVRRLDWLASTGLAVDAAGGRVARLLRDAGGAGACGELLVSDERGIQLYRRVDALVDAHDALWHDGALVVAATSSNSLLWLDAGGEVTRSWKGAGDGDAWHINSLVVHEGRLLACAFGRFAEHRGWAVPGAAREQGIVFDVESGETVIGGLTCPHHPFRLDGRWAVCDSADKVLVVFEDGGRVAQRVALGAWTRGVALAGDRLYVGLSAHRHEQPGVRAAVAILDRLTLAELARVELPAREVYALAAVPEPLVAGMERGFRTNAARVADSDQHALFRAAGVEPELLWAVSDPLPEAACRTTLGAELPTTVQEGETIEVAWTLTNHGGAILQMADPHPVRIGARWFALDGTPLGDDERAPLGASVPPATTANGTIALTAPLGAGERILRLAPVQEFVRWFDDVDPANGIEARVTVVDGTSAFANLAPGVTTP
jgi:acetolactate synthase-1/2/3 large subunit